MCPFLKFSDVPIIDIFGCAHYWHFRMCPLWTFSEVLTCTCLLIISKPSRLAAMISVARTVVSGSRYLWARHLGSFRDPLCRDGSSVLSWTRSHFLSLSQCCGAATFLGGSGSWCPRSRSWLRLRLQPTWVGSDSRQKEAAPAPAPYTKIFHFKLSKS